MIIATPGSKMPDAFLSAVAAPNALEGSAYWFVFQGSQLLARKEEGRAAVPFVMSLQELGLEPVRTQYLGVLGARHCFAAECAAETTPSEGYSWFGLRALFGLLDDTMFGLAGRAVQIVDWDRAHQYCGQCGSLTQAKANERARQCASCGLTHYPRIAPAVMALVRREDHLLLARSPHFPPGMHSALAGFVEPGESLEQCLQREVREEVGIEVANLRYFASQPWPFPHSLMIAFNCDYAGGDIAPDPTEIESAAWFDLDHLPVLPNKISIARRLIDATIANMKAGTSSG